MFRPCGCPLDVGRKYHPGVGISGTICTCCGSFEICVKLPVGAGHIFNCVHCLNPRVIGPEKKVTRKSRAMSRFRAADRIARLPKLLHMLLKLDPDQVSNDAPSEQSQRRMQRFSNPGAVA